MKIAAASLGVFLAGIVSTANAVAYEVASCAELGSLDDTTITELTVTVSQFDCSEYTRFRVRNAMTLSATVPEVTFSNFALKVLGELTVEPDVVFTDVHEQEKNGGTLYVQEGATATFMGTAGFSNNTVMETELPPVVYPDGGYSPRYIKKKGAALHNKGILVFEKDSTFDSNVAVTRDNTNQGKGGAISNSGSGSILFKGKLTMTNNEAEGFFEGKGGCIYNRGDIVVEGESMFTGNSAAEGGVIFQTKIGSVTFNGMASFVDNICYESRGGAIANFGGKLVFNAASLFEDNYASSSGDGGAGAGIYTEDGGDITFVGKTIFKGNTALNGAGIFMKMEAYIYSSESLTDYVAPTLTLPAAATDLVFEDNQADYCPEIAYYYKDSHECGP